MSPYMLWAGLLSTTLLASHAWAKADYNGQQRVLNFEKCAAFFPENNPKLVLDNYSQALNTSQLCSDSFAVLYSKRTKTPLVVVEKLNATMMQAKGETSGQTYFADPRVDKGEAAEMNDWNGAGMDKGRLALLSTYGQSNASAQTYALTNVVAQPPRFHKQVWSKVETEVKNYVSVAKGDVYVYTGALFTSIDKMQILGNNRVWVPTHLYKLVYDPTTNNAWAYVVANEADAQIGKPLNYESFMRTARLRLLPN